jgi:pyruvate/2-oxoglutarate dehydrogenase complex dihydrolipoamide dehydrogenase (E3) component
MSTKGAENPKEFDLIVIGGGPAGIIGATTAVALGKSVAVVDSHHELGGVGANTGTVPGKTLRETALAPSGMRSRNLCGVDLSLRTARRCERQIDCQLLSSLCPIRRSGSKQPPSNLSR